MAPGCNRFERDASQLQSVKFHTPSPDNRRLADLVEANLRNLLTSAREARLSKIRSARKARRWPLRFSETCTGRLRRPTGLRPICRCDPFVNREPVGRLIAQAFCLHEFDAA